MNQSDIPKSVELFFVIGKKKRIKKRCPVDGGSVTKTKSSGTEN